MISNKYKCIFVEVPKTGSSSIRSIIGQPPMPHLNICQIARKISDAKFRSYFKFGFVRNPWDRTVSLYERKEGLELRSAMSFSDFVEWIKFSSSTCHRALPHRYQYDWFVDSNGSIVVDYIARFENLQKEWADISSKIGTPSQLPERNINHSKTKHYSEYYSAKTKEIIRNKFAFDIEFFEYEFES